MSISGYDVKLFNPVTGQEVIRKSQGYETFYTLKFNEEDECFRQETTMVEVRILIWIQWNLSITNTLGTP